MVLHGSKWKVALENDPPEYSYFPHACVQWKEKRIMDRTLWYTCENGGRRSGMRLSRIRGIVANYLASQVKDPRIDSHQHQKDSWHIWRHLRKDIVSSCNLCWLLIFLHGRSRIYCVASLQAGLVSRISPLHSTLLRAASNKGALFQILFKSICG